MQKNYELNELSELFNDFNIKNINNVIQQAKEKGMQKTILYCKIFLLSFLIFHRR